MRAPRTSPVVCCRQCGRDTRARDAVCHRCRGSAGPHDSGRRSLREVVAQQDDDGLGRDRYHGDTDRDDV